MYVHKSPQDPTVPLFVIEADKINAVKKRQSKNTEKYQAIEVIIVAYTLGLPRTCG